MAETNLTSALRYIDSQGRLIAPAIKRDLGPVPMLRDIPDLRDMAALNRAELYEVAQAYGLLQPVETLLAKKSAVAAELRRVPQGLLTADTALVNTTERELVEMARRAVREYGTFEAVAGNPDQVLVWVAEGDERSCDQCMDRAGTEGTYEDHAALGLPDDVCAGGSACRCYLIAVD